MNGAVKRRVGTVIVIAGVLCIAVAAALLIGNELDDKRAGEYSAGVVSRLKEEQAAADASHSDPATESAQPQRPYELDPSVEMPVTVIDGDEYIGTVAIPTIDLELPVMSELNYDDLKKSPCRYSGSVYQDDMVIAAHNYRSQFGSIHSLATGDTVIFTDTDGNEFLYSVTVVDILQPYSVPEMKQGDWDLTLFTCTRGGEYRVTVRCAREV